MNRQEQKKGFERKKKKNGSANPRYLDVLTPDDPLAGQAYGCFSFLSPERILKQKEMYFFNHFLKQWDFHKSMEKFHPFLAYLSFKYKLTLEEITQDYTEYVTTEQNSLQSCSVEDEYKTFLDNNEEKLQKQFDIDHNFQTSVRGVKNSGNFATEEEARFRAKMLHEKDGTYDIFIGPVGVWMPWDPEPYKTGEVQYMEEELNQLAHEKKKNEDVAKVAFDQRVRESKEHAIEENKKLAEKHGNVITQDIDENGQLVGTGINTVERSFTHNDKGVTLDEMCESLFNDETVVTKKE